MTVHAEGNFSIIFKAHQIWAVCNPISRSSALFDSVLTFPPSPPNFSRLSYSTTFYGTFVRYLISTSST
ncbi:hypothetical protein HYQ44_010598 [Verticillium longisporum]|nr:hypothetical protein HYQ44_010598 [Verticillium longisporum]